MGSGDTGEACGARLVGGGCGFDEPSLPRCDPRTGEEVADVEPLPGEVRGGGACGCDSAGGAEALALAVATAVALVRRWGPLALLAWVGVAHAQVDAQRLQVADGGEFPALWEGDLGARWSGGVTGSLNAASTLAVLEGVREPDVLLDEVWTWEGAASLNLGGVTRVGLALPFHAVTFRGQRLDGLQRGDLAVWLSVPMTSADNPVRASWTVKIDAPTGRPDLLLGDSGVVTGLFAARFPAGPMVAAANLGAAFQKDVPLPGAVWGNHWVYGLGLRAEPAGPSWVTAELQGNVPVRFWAGEPARYPAEVLLSAGAVPSPLVSVGAGLGTGLSRGLGSPRLRGLLMIDARQRTERDQDADGIADLRDLCRREPEDRDGFRDNDGCPDVDNDQDGLADVRDTCPDQAEVVNGFEDGDGCPDRLTVLTVRVRPVHGLDEARVTVGAARPVVVFPGESVERRLDLDSVDVDVVADGFEAWHREVELLGEPLVHEVELVPIRYGSVALEVVGESGDALDARVRVDDDEVLVAVDGPLELRAGPRRLEVSAPGCLPSSVEVDVPAGGAAEVRVALRASRISVEAGRLRIEDDIGFEVDAAELAPESAPVLDELAAWLRAHPEAQLVRVEGHADETGTSRYNYELSRRRAEAVVAGLVARGVDPARLEAIGTGEARATGGEGTDRRVELVVLVWSTL